jgi:serine/threonine protein phosphatase PrpC
VGHSTDVGRMRQGNEDSYLIASNLQLFAVADGMGGHRAGEVASHAALGALAKVLKEDPALPLTDAVGLANDAVYQMAVDDPSLQGMGTTLTAVRMDGGAAILGHVGDSRAYLLRDGQLLRITEDHSFVDQLRREGRITEEQAATHPQRSILTRALGIEPGVVVDPGQIDLLDGDRLLLCSDGLHALVRDPVILDILRRHADPQAASEALVAAANAAGGDDNITAVVIDVHDDDGAAHERAVAASAAVESSAETPDTGGATVDLAPTEMLPVVGPDLDVNAPTATAGSAADDTMPLAAVGAPEGPDAAPGAAAGAATATATATQTDADAGPADGDGDRGGRAARSAGVAPEPSAPRKSRRSKGWLIPVVVVLAMAAAIAAAVVIVTDDEDSPSKPALTSASAPTPSSASATTTTIARPTTTLAATTTAGATTTAATAATTAAGGVGGAGSVGSGASGTVSPPTAPVTTGTAGGG